MADAPDADADNLVLNLRPPAAALAPLDAGAASGGGMPPELEAFLAREARARMGSRVSWKHLETCFKWRLIERYLEDKGVPVDAPVAGQVRSLLSSKKLCNVEFDAALRRVVRLNHADL